MIKTTAALLLALSLLLPACAGGPPTPPAAPSAAPASPATPVTTSAPSPPTTAPLPTSTPPAPSVEIKSTEQVLRDTVYDTRQVSEEITAFTGKYTLRQIKDDKGELVWAHNYVTNVGSQAFIVYFPSQNIQKAQLILSDTAYMAANRKLPTETLARRLTDDELIKTVQVEGIKALDLLKSQIRLSNSAQARDAKWAVETKQVTASEEERKHSVAMVIDYHETYRKKLNGIIDRLERINTYIDEYLSQAKPVFR